jgi:membrane peptidoglycan carboxypeptidase
VYSSDATQNAQLNSQVQYAMEDTTVNGTGTPAGVGLGNRQIIAKTGTSSSYHSGFFIGAIKQYSLVVGMFTQSQNVASPESLAVLTGGGFGGYWPAKIWNTFAQSEFTQLPYKNFQTPNFSGAAWNQVGKIAKPKPTVTCVVNGKKTKVPGKSCPTPTPSPTPTCTDFGQTNCVTPSESASPTPTCSYDGESTFDGCTTATAPVSPSPSPTCSYQGETDCSSTGTAGATPSPTPTCSFQGQSDCSSTGTGGAFPQTTATATATPASSAKAGFAAAGTGLLLPGSLALALARRRRRRAGTRE